MQLTEQEKLAETLQAEIDGDQQAKAAAIQAEQFTPGQTRLVRLDLESSTVTIGEARYGLKQSDDGHWCGTADGHRITARYIRKWDVVAALLRVHNKPWTY